MRTPAAPRPETAEPKFARHGSGSEHSDPTLCYHSPMHGTVDPVKETCRLIRLARSYWDAHRNHACRRNRDIAMKLYEGLSKEQKEEIPQVLRVWLRYRSEKYFGPDRTAPGTGGRKKKRQP